MLHPFTKAIAQPDSRLLNRLMLAHYVNYCATTTRPLEDIRQLFCETGDVRKRETTFWFPQSEGYALVTQSRRGQRMD